MKKLSFILALGLFLNIQASAANFSAFVLGDDVYITTIVDNCNAHAMDFTVSGLCHADRLTDNYATVCDIRLSIISTQRVCITSMDVPMTFVHSLTERRVTPEAQVLNLNLHGETISIPVQ